MDPLDNDARLFDSRSQSDDSVGSSFNVNASTGTHDHDHDRDHDHDHAPDDTTFASGHGQQQQQVQNPRTYQLAAKEIKQVQRTKYVVIFSLLVIMLGVSMTAYVVSSREEIEEFEIQFYEDTDKVFSTMGHNLVRTLQASDAFVISITSLADATNQDWPYVVVPNFAVRAEKIRSLANAVYVSTYNLVRPNGREEWEAFTAETGASVVNESIAAIENFDGMDWPIVWNYTLWDIIHDYDEFEKDNPGEIGVDTLGPWFPQWQIQPTIAFEPPYNWDLTSTPPTKVMNITASQNVLNTQKVTITDAYLISYPDDTEHIENDLEEADWISSYLQQGEEAMEPISDIFYPIIDGANNQIDINRSNSNQQNVVGIFSLAIYWRDTIKNIISDGDGSRGLLIVFENPCNPTFTYQLNGPDAVFLGAGDLHDRKYDHLMMSKTISELTGSAMEESLYSGIQLDDEFCPFHISIYPSDATKNHYTTNTPIYFAMITVGIFFITASTFTFYEFWVERRQKVVMKTALTTTAFVSSLFPDVVIDQMLPIEKTYSATGDNQPKRLKTFLNDGKDDDILSRSQQGLYGLSKPIAEFFPDTTVYFADIAGFTAWASVREPSHVFTLLETLYGEFDQIAKHYGIFKVETVGDSYVAVCGLPEARKNHAVATARFAMECLEAMKDRTRELELYLGPGTADLRLRIGLHSGPTIAGVLRGEKARFQLFGDTVNTAARMESTGEPNRIQVSQKTADLITAAGKERWLIRREEFVNAKGKGQLQTYWLERNKRRRTSSFASSVDSSYEGNVVSNIESTRRGSSIDNPKPQRLIDWNVCIFRHLLEEVASHRHKTLSNSNPKVLPNERLTELSSKKTKHARDEIAETIRMPEYRGAVNTGSERFELSHSVIDELRDYITRIAHLYCTDNKFHNFEHASHVTMSTVKLLQRIASPDVKKKDCETDQDYYNYTFGISSDPLTKFAIVFSALIHDVDHRGVSNLQLAKEKDPMTLVYGNKSVLEQHSLDLAWSILEESRFTELRECIYTTRDEYERFRQLTVNCVMATDILDKELKAFRDSRWDKAFQSTNQRQDSSVSKSSNWNRKATIVIEYIIQASDVAHTMQHWHVYQKWNKCLFHEMYTAYQNGRSDKDPSDGWYEGELWFFDNYVIPLATKLRECEVFGVSCDEFLDFANENRKEWSLKGRGIVAEMLNKIRGHGGLPVST